LTTALLSDRWVLLFDQRLNGSLHELRIHETPLRHRFGFKDLLAFWRKTGFCLGEVFPLKQALESYLRSEATNWLRGYGEEEPA
jgi:hypothetical protein